MIGSAWSYLAKWDGHDLSSLGDGCEYPRELESFDDGAGGGSALYAAGYNMSYCGGNLAYPDLARWYGGCTHAIDPLCFGDGSFAACPCANYGAPQHGCANSSTSQGALLGASGSTIPDTLVLHSSGELASSLSIFVQGDAPRPVQIPFGDGILCVGGPLLRLYAKLASGGSAQAPAAGDLSISQRSAGLGHPIAAGTARYYQVWYRDGAAGFCTPNSFNVSNALRVGW